jgi:kynurenine formamidase
VTASSDRPEEFERLAERVRNWHRWGPDDELGTLNFITPDKRRAAAALVRSGAVFSLSIPFGMQGPQTGVANRVNPIHLMLASGADPPAYAMDLGGTARYTDDYVIMPLQCGTQWDSLAHIYYGEQLYNGYPAHTVNSQGALRNGIDKTHERFVSRGVLLDVARMKGVDVLESGYAISVADLEATEQKESVEVSSGDLLLVRTGLMSTWVRTGTWDGFGMPQPGLHWAAAEWLHDRQVAAVATDTSVVEVVGLLGDLQVPLHMLALRDMGLPLGEFWNLEELGDDCAVDHRYDFLLIAQALPVVGAVGSPVNPIAIK